MTKQSDHTKYKYGTSCRQTTDLQTLQQASA